MRILSNSVRKKLTMDTEVFEKEPTAKNGEDGYSTRKGRKADNVDPLTEIIGQMGWFQITWYMLVNSAVIVHNWQMVVNKFLTYPVSMNSIPCRRASHFSSARTLSQTDHWCAQPPGSPVMPAEAWINMSAPLKADGSFDKCNVFDVDYSLTFARPGENTPTRACQAWDYDEEYFTVRSMIIENKNRDHHSFL